MSPPFKGTNNPVANALSRVEINALRRNHNIDFVAMAKAQTDDPDLSTLRSFSPLSPLQLSNVPIPASNTTLVCDLSTGVPRSVVPESFRRTMFDSLHSLSHPGVRATQRLITSQYVWLHVKADVCIVQVDAVMFAVPTF